MSNETKSDGKGYQLRGEVVHIGGVETVGAKGFNKRMIVVRTDDDKYPQEVPIYFTQANTSKLDAAFVGHDVTVTFDLRGREWNGKYYPELNGWKIVNHSAQRPAATDQEPTPGTAPAASGDRKPAPHEEEMPF